VRTRLTASVRLVGMLGRYGRRAILAFFALCMVAVGLYQIPAVRSRLDWRYEVWSTYAKNAVDPVGPLPTPVPSTPFATFTPLPPTPTSVATHAPTPTAIPLPAQVSLPSPEYERQGINNCGPATLAMTLRMYGWKGSQDDIAKVIKPVPQDRNVNPDELRYYVLNEAGWLRAEYRVAGDLQVLQRLLAANYPVVIEEASTLDPQDANGPADDLWDAHYLLITGYDQVSGTFTAQDPLRGPDKHIPFDVLMSDWKPFNYLYMVIYFPQDEQEVKSILGADWDPAQNRQRALTLAQEAVSSDPNDAFAWFDLGSTLVYFERYQEAAQAFDKAFTIGLPQRMTRYQFWPFSAYYNADRIDYLLELTENTYKPINGYYSEEALLWHGYGLLRQGDTAGATADWYKALEVHPGYCDAEKAINDFIQPTYDLLGCSP
jgi:tetratricopeptide (TPR) repeat protein